MLSDVCDQLSGVATAEGRGNSLNKGNKKGDKEGPGITLRP